MAKVKKSVVKDRRSSIIKISVDTSEEDFQNEEETMAYVLSSMVVTNNLKGKEREEKSGKGAFRALNRVNRIRSTASLQVQLELYSRAIAHAPLESYELVRAYTERSELLLNQGYYKDCLKDIERISKIGCCNEMKADFYTRKAKALWGLNPRMRPEIEKAITKAQCWLTEANEETRQNIETSLNLILKNYALKTNFIQHDLGKLIPLTPKDNPRVVGASGSIELKFSENFGRHIVATKDIKVGEVIFVQKAYSLILSSECWYTYCWYCSKRTWSSVGCNNCVNVIYCDESCRDKAWVEYHDMECDVISYLLAMGQREWLDLMAARITIKAIKEAGSLQNLKTYLLNIDKIPDPTEKFFTDNVHDSSKYSTVYSLVHDVSFREKSEVDGLSISSAYILHAFALSSNLLGDGINDIRDCANNEWALFLGELILRNIRISSLNCFSLSTPFIDMKRGDLLGSFASFFNHSCFSNVCPAHYGNTMTFRASQQIKKGAQLFISYGSSFDETPTLQRREQLKDDYNFWCECIACHYDWNPASIFPTLVNKRTLSEIEFKIKELIQKNDKKALTTMQQSSKSNTWNDNSHTLQSLCDLLNLMCENLDYRSREMLSFKILLESNYVHNADIYNDNCYIVKCT